MPFTIVYAKKYVLPLNVPVSALLTYQLGLSLVILFLITSLEGIGDVWSDPLVGTGLVVGIGMPGTGLVYITYYYIIEKLGVVSASSVTYIPPVVAIAIGVIIVGEKISSWEYLGTVFIFMGVIMINRKRADNKPNARAE